MGTSEPGSGADLRGRPHSMAKPVKMFDRAAADALFDELRREWKGSPEYERLVRDAHVAIARFDASRPIGSEVTRPVIELIERHRPRS